MAKTLEVLAIVVPSGLTLFQLVVAIESAPNRDKVMGRVQGYGMSALRAITILAWPGSIIYEAAHFGWSTFFPIFAVSMSLLVSGTLAVIFVRADRGKKFLAGSPSVDHQVAALQAQITELKKDTSLREVIAGLQRAIELHEARVGRLEEGAEGERGAGKLVVN
ncbi:MAG TPA: hypothetical protein VGM77_02110 [Gemmatimonadales bacterium]|jgi:hypothetical protein